MPFLVAGPCSAYMEGHVSPLLLRVPSGVTMQDAELSAVTPQHGDGAGVSTVERANGRARLTLALRLQPGQSAVSPHLQLPWCSIQYGWGPATSDLAPP